MRNCDNVCVTQPSSTQNPTQNPKHNCTVACCLPTKYYSSNKQMHSAQLVQVGEEGTEVVQSNDVAAAVPSSPTPHTQECDSNQCMNNSSKQS